MNRRSWAPRLASSNNLKSKIENPGWWGIFVIIFAIGFSDVVAWAQQAKKVPRIGYLSQSDPARESARTLGLRLALREVGYIEGQNIAIEYRYAAGTVNRL